MYCSVNGQLTHLNEVCIRVNDLALLRGYGIFDFFRVRDHVPLFFEDHLDRFYQSAGIARLSPPLDKDELRDHILEMIHLNNIPMSGVRLLLTGGYTEDGYTPGRPNLIVTQEAVRQPTASAYRNGVALITHEFQREVPRAKTIGYMTGIWLTERIREAGAMDVLYHSNGHVTELTRSNIFIVQQDDTIKTPSENILYGITRNNVLNIARQHYTVISAEVTLEEVYSAKEVFITSTLKKIVPVVKIDEKVCGNGRPGKITLRLLELFNAFEEQYIEGARVNF